MLGTTKPPYTLLLMAALLRERGLPLRLVDLTAEQRSTESLIAELGTRRVPPDADRLPVHHADAATRTSPRWRAQGRVWRAARLLRAARLRRRRSSRWRTRRSVDAMIVGEPEDAVLALAAQDSLDAGRRPEPDLAARRRDRPALGARQLRGLPDDALSGVGSAAISAATACRWSSSPTSSSRRAAAARTRATSASRRSIRATSSASAIAEGARRRDRAGHARARRRVLLSLGRHRHAQREDVQRLLRGADRAQPADPVVRQRPRRQPDRSGVRPSAAPVRLLDARDGHRVRVAGDRARTW